MHLQLLLEAQRTLPQIPSAIQRLRSCRSPGTAQQRDRYFVSLGLDPGHFPISIFRGLME
jgi:hypothetical protein